MPSSIDPTKPVEGEPASKSALRNNLAAAKAEIEDLQQTGPVSLKRFGAKCDGVTDDTQAFQSAADSGEPLWLPRGKTLITEPILSTNTNFLLHGAGGQWSAVSGSQLVSNFDGEQINIGNVKLGGPPGYIYDESARVHCGSVDIRGIHFKQNGNYGANVFLSQTQLANIDGCTFEHNYRGLMMLRSNFNTLVRGCRFKNSWKGGAKSIETWDWENSIALYLSGHSSCMQNNFQHCGIGLLAIGNSCNCVGARFEVCGTGLQVGGMSYENSFGSWLCSQSMFTGMTFESNYRGIHIHTPGFGVEVSNVHVTHFEGAAPPSTNGNNSEYGLLTRIGSSTLGLERIKSEGYFTRAAIVWPNNKQGMYASQIVDQQTNPEGVGVEGTPP